ncbi:MAG: hypothetical protein AB2A00_24610 [Myxococcota bacterium]
MAGPASGMLFKDYLGAFRRSARRWEPAYRLTRVGTARSAPRAAPLVRLANARPRKSGLMLLSGFHGEEPAGPLTLLTFLHHIVGRATDLGVPLCIYPVVNPYGFDTMKRTTVAGEYTNAGFIHDEDPTGPEVAQLRADMVKFAPQVFLDLHEDDNEQRTYLYAFGDEKLGARLVERASHFITPAHGSLSHTPSMKVVHGQIRDYHDGSSEDFMGHQPTTLASFASETPTKLELRLRMSVHLAMIDACLDEVAARRARRR